MLHTFIYHSISGDYVDLVTRPSYDFQNSFDTGWKNMELASGDPVFQKKLAKLKQIAQIKFQITNAEADNLITMFDTRGFNSPYHLSYVYPIETVFEFYSMTGKFDIQRVVPGVVQITIPIRIIGTAVPFIL
jgi:hypothetical protein